jgi:HPt (histidine-containing phosphotransfer) domain-containing protein
VLDLLERSPYDLVLMDMQMPEMDGLESSRQIHARWGDDPHPHIVAMTANATLADREACLAAGMDDYVSKPVHLPTLVAALERAAASRPDAPPVPSASPNVTPGAARTPDIPTDVPAVDRDAVLAAGDPEFMAELIATFLEDAPRLLGQLRDAVSSGDAVTVRLVAHGLKSNGAEFGAATFSDLCREMEALGKVGGLAAAPALLAQIEAGYTLVARELRDIASLSTQ